MCDWQLGHVWTEQWVPIFEDEWNKLIQDKIHERKQVKIGVLPV